MSDMKKMDSQTQQTQQLYDALEESGYTVAITGAGISIAAGGVTFKGMMQRFHGDMRSDDPQQMYDAFDRAFFGSMFRHGPTHAHEALARLEQRGKMQGIITTNGDCLHTMAGSKNVAEIQGSYQVNICTGCGKEFHDCDIWDHGKMPVCDKCGSIILPFAQYSHIGLYEPDLQKAREWIAQAELILIIGATGCYGGTYWDYRRQDARIIQINHSRTAFDPAAYLNIREDIEPAFEELMELMDQSA